MRIYVAGHEGMVGTAIVRKLKAKGATLLVRKRAELDLTDQAAVRDFMFAEKPDSVVLAAAKVGGIQANNTYPAEFVYENLMMECNVIHQAFQAGVRRLLFLGSSCIYPRAVAQPMREDALLAQLVDDQQLNAGEMLLELAQSALVYGLNQFVHQRRRRHEGDAVPLLASSKPQREREMCFACAAYPCRLGAAQDPRRSCARHLGQGK